MAWIKLYSHFKDGKGQGDKRGNVWLYKANNLSLRLKKTPTISTHILNLPSATRSAPRLLMLGLHRAAVSFPLSLLWGSWETTASVWRAPTA